MTRSQAIAEVGFKRVLIATEDIMDMEVESTSTAVCKIARSIKTCPRNTALLFMGANQPNANASVVATMRMGGALILGSFVKVAIVIARSCCRRDNNDGVHSSGVRS